MAEPNLNEIDNFSGPGVQGDMVEITRFTDPSEAQMAKGMLDAAGIEASLEGELSNALYPGVFRTVLAVKTVDEAAARALMAQVEATPPGAE